MFCSGPSVISKSIGYKVWRIQSLCGTRVRTSPSDWPKGNFYLEQIFLSKSRFCTLFLTQDFEFIIGSTNFSFGNHKWEYLQNFVANLKKSKPILLSPFSYKTKPIKYFWEIFLQVCKLCKGIRTSITKNTNQGRADARSSFSF